MGKGADEEGTGGWNRDEGLQGNWGSGSKKIGVSTFPGHSGRRYDLKRPGGLEY